MKSSKINQIVRQEMCIGCGVCVSESPKSLKMEINDYGFFCSNNNKQRRK